LTIGLLHFNGKEKQKYIPFGIEEPAGRAGS
jgi:hypothetical protein